jgi:hypothetical protein
MIQSELDRAVAGATGESLTKIRALGFSALSLGATDLEPEDIDLRVECPLCSTAVPYPGRASDGSSALAECRCCDLYFDFAPEDVRTIVTTCETTARVA